MVPTTLSAVIGFIIFVAPGIPWAQRVQRHQSWRSEDSSFREISQGVLWSIWFSLPATALVIGGLSLANRTWLNDEDQWFVTGKPPNGATLLVAGVAAVCELLIAMALMGAAWKLLSPRLYPGAPAFRESAWKKMLGATDPRGSVAGWVALNSGKSWAGEVAGFRDDNPWADRELILHNPTRINPDGTRGTQYPGDLIIPAASIESVHARQMPPPSAHRVGRHVRLSGAWNVWRGRAIATTIETPSSAVTGSSEAATSDIPT